jgi:hypothetical protein
VGLNVGGGYWLGGYDLFETRGLGPVRQVPEYEVQLKYGTDQRRDWELETEPKLTLMQDGAREYGLTLEGEWTATRRLSLQLETQDEWERGVRAWSSNDAFRPTGPGGWAIGTTQGSRTNRPRPTTNRSRPATVWTPFLPTPSRTREPTPSTGRSTETATPGRWTLPCGAPSHLRPTSPSSSTTSSSWPAADTTAFRPSSAPLCGFSCSPHGLVRLDLNRVGVGVEVDVVGPGNLLPYSLPNRVGGLNHHIPAPHVSSFYLHKKNVPRPRK